MTPDDKLLLSTLEHARADQIDKLFRISQSENKPLSQCVHEAVEQYLSRLDPVTRREAIDILEQDGWKLNFRL